MSTIITRLLFNAIGLFAIAYYVPGIEVDSLYPAVISVLVLGLLNLFIRPILFILTLPINVLTLGLFSFIINALLFWFASSFIQGLHVDGFTAALIGSALMSIVSTVGNRWIRSGKR